MTDALSAFPVLYALNATNAKQISGEDDRCDVHGFDFMRGLWFSVVRWV